MPIAEGVRAAQNQLGTGGAAFAVSETGVLVYQAASSASESHLLWFDRTGNQLSVLREQAAYRNPRLSPNGTRVAAEIVDTSGNRDLWFIDIARPVTMRFTFDAAGEAAPVWAPDGSHVAFYAGPQIFQKVASGVGTLVVNWTAGLKK
jgi:Tol biopolymer transport system component